LVEKNRIAHVIVLALDEFGFVFSRCNRQKAPGPYRIV
jgi:hypothetical protein